MHESVSTTTVTSAQRVLCPASRRGFTLVEVAVAAVLITVAMALIVQIAGWVASERRTAMRRQWALREADNLMERITARPWEAITNDQLHETEAADRVRRELPDGRLTTDVLTRPSEPNAKRVHIEIRWKNRTGSGDAPVQLTAWVFRAAEGGR